MSFLVLECSQPLFMHAKEKASKGSARGASRKHTGVGVGFASEVSKKD